MKIFKLIGLIFLILLALWFFVGRYYTLATERECGFNPIKHFKIISNELWCGCENETGNNSYYGGFSCMNCERFCEKYNLGKVIPFKDGLKK